MKRFSKLERARPERDEEPAATEPAAKRFEAIERPHDAPPREPNPFAPPPVENANLQLELHDRYSDQVEDARRGRERRATESLVRLQEEAVAREQPVRAVNVLDLLARGAALGPLARVGDETRLWAVGGVLIAMYFAIALGIGGGLAFIVVGALAGALVLRGRLTA